MHIFYSENNNSNIFVENETAKVGDFGLTEIFNDENFVLSNHLKYMAYTSPEVIESYTKKQTKSDVWSLGCCIYEVIKLEPLFDYRKTKMVNHFKENIMTFDEKSLEINSSVLKPILQK